MKIYAVQYDDVGSLNPVVLLRTDSLHGAIAAAEADRTGKTYVRHEASDLQRYVFDGRAVWLDDHGVEHQQPCDSASR